MAVVTVYTTVTKNRIMTPNILTMRSRDELLSLEERILSGLDQENDGIQWWAGHDLGIETRCGLSHNLIDAVHGIDKHLTMAVFYQREYSKKRSSGDFLLRSRMHNNGGDPSVDKQSKQSRGTTTTIL